MTKIKFNIRDAAGAIIVRGYTYSEKTDQKQIEYLFESLEFDWKQYHCNAASYDIFSIEQEAA